jgi:hypothetical protein
MRLTVDAQDPLKLAVRDGHQFRIAQSHNIRIAGSSNEYREQHLAFRRSAFEKTAVPDTLRMFKPSLGATETETAQRSTDRSLII